jgi:hypothetical protein
LLGDFATDRDCAHHGERSHVALRLSLVAKPRDNLSASDDAEGWLSAKPLQPLHRLGTTLPRINQNTRSISQRVIHERVEPLTPLAAQN